MTSNSKPGAAVAFKSSSHLQGWNLQNKFFQTTAAGSFLQHHSAPTRGWFSGPFGRWIGLVLNWNKIIAFSTYINKFSKKTQLLSMSEIEIIPSNIAKNSVLHFI